MFGQGGCEYLELIVATGQGADVQWLAQETPRQTDRKADGGMAVAGGLYATSMLQ